MIHSQNRIENGGDESLKENKNCPRFQNVWTRRCNTTMEEDIRHRACIGEENGCLARVSWSALDSMRRDRSRFFCYPFEPFGHEPPRKFRPPAVAPYILLTSFFFFRIYNRSIFVKKVPKAHVKGPEREPNVIGWLEGLSLPSKKEESDPCCCRNIL